MNFSMKKLSVVAAGFALVLGISACTDATTDVSTLLDEMAEEVDSSASDASCSSESEDVESSDDAEPASCAAAESSDDADDESSSSEDADDESSSSDDAESSADADDESSSSDDAESSADADDESSSSEEVESSAEVAPESSSEAKLESAESSSSAVVVEKENMTPVDEETSKELDDMKDALDDESKENPEGFEKSDDLTLKQDEMDFNNNDYYCLTEDGTWYKIEDKKLTALAKFWNALVEFFTGKPYFDFSKSCDALYIRRHQN